MRAGEQFSIGELGFGTGLNFIHSWGKWLEYAPKEAQLNYFSIEKHPISPENLSRIYKSIKFAINNFLKIYKNINFRRYNFSIIYRYLDFRKYDFSRIYRRVRIVSYINLVVYFFTFIIFLGFLYVIAPMFFTGQ